MLKKYVSLLVLFVPFMVCAQTNPNYELVEKMHREMDLPQEVQPGPAALRVAKVSQAAADAQLTGLLKAYPSYEQPVRRIIRTHDQLVALLQNEQERDFDASFYQDALMQLEDLAATVSGLGDEKLVVQCKEILDHGYYFARMGDRLASLRVITDHVAAQSALSPAWGNFYQFLDMYSH